VSQIPQFLLRHEVTVEAFRGDGARGPVYGPPATVRCFVDDQRRRVRDSGGNEVVSSTTVRTLLGVDAPAGSRVTLADGREATVIQALRRDGGGLPTPDHLELVLT
jgi:hypothetical protein